MSFLGWDPRNLKKIKDEMELFYKVFKKNIENKGKIS